MFGRILALLCGGSLFTDVTIFYSIREKVSANWFRYRRRIASLYDTFLLYGEEDNEEREELLSQEEKPERNGEAEAEQGGGPSASGPLPSD